MYELRGVAKRPQQKNRVQKTRLDWAFKAASRRVF